VCLVGVGLAERSAPLPDGLVGDRDAALQHHLLDVAEAQREPVIEPHAVADDLRREAEPSVRRRLGAHQPSPLNALPDRSADHPSHPASQVDGARRGAWPRGRAPGAESTGRSRWSITGSGPPSTGLSSTKISKSKIH
jgi:hypothetical protein